MSFLPSKRLKNPFNESIITNDFVLEIFSITDFKSLRKTVVFLTVK